MPAFFDAVGGGNSANGPTNNTLTTPWSHDAVEAGVVLAGFSYDTTAPNLRSIGHTVTYNGEPMELLRQQPKGHWPYVTGAPGYVELWGAISEAGAHNISVGLAYEQDIGDPWSEAGATFSNFKGSSVSYTGVDGFAPDSAQGWSGCSKLITAPISAFMNTITVGVIGADAAFLDDFNQTERFMDASSQLLIADARGPGAFKIQNDGGANWAVCTVNLRPVKYLGADQGTGMIW